MEHSIQQDIIGFLLTLLIGAFFVHWSAKLVLDRSSFFSAMLAFFLGTLLASLLRAFLAPPIGEAAATVAALAGMAAVFAAVYRTKWTKGAIVGVVAWVIWAAVQFLVRLIF